MGDLARSSRRSLSPRPCRKAPSLFEGTTVPPCWWDEEYPKKQQQLRRSMSDRRQRVSPTKLSIRAHQRTNTKEFRSSSSSSLWSAENREYLEMRFGLIQQSSNKEATKHGDDDASSMKKDGEQECGEEFKAAELEAEWEKNKGHSASASSDEASSIFSNPDCSSFSSGSDLSSIAAKEESSSPPAAEVPAAAAASSSHEQNCAGFLEFDLVEGHLVAESARGEECEDFVTARASEDELPPAAAAAAQDGISPSNSDKKKAALRSSSRPLPHSSFVHDDCYPVWASSSNWHLLRSYKERITVGDGGKRCSERKQVARRLLRGCSPVSTHHMFHMISGSLFSPRIGPLRGSSSPPLREPSEFLRSSSPAPKVADVFGKNSSESGSDTEQQQQQQRQQRLKHSASRAAALNSKLVSITRKRQQQLVATEEPEISCRPFLPVAAAKKSCISRRPLFSLRKNKCSSEAIEPSSSSTEISVRQAHLHCVVRNDHHSYTFVVDNSEELLVARTGEEGSKGASCSFYSWKQKRKPKGRSWKSAWSSKKRDDPKPESELVGSMRLSKKFCNPTKRDSIDLEFVLLKGCSSSSEEEDQEQVLPEMGSPSRLSFSSWDLRKSPCSLNSAKALRNPWWYVGQSPSLSPARAWMKKKSLSQNCSPSRGKIDDDNMDVLRDLWMRMETAEREETTDNSCSQSEEELAAFVITVPSAKKKRNWTEDHQYHGIHDEHNKMTSSNSTRNVTVILPVGHHGLPSDGSRGPRPLIERWRSAGKCDCGSWDLGCALNILQQQQQQQEQSNLLKVSLQGSSKQQQEVLNLVALRNGLFSISFKEPLSPLQAFAAAVAILRSSEGQEEFMGMHSRAPLQALDGYGARGIIPWSKSLGIPCSNNGSITSNASSLLPFERL